MIDINEPLELDDGTPMKWNRSDTDGTVQVRYPDGEIEWFILKTGHNVGDPKAPKLRNTAKPTEAPKKSDDQEFWERVFLAQLKDYTNAAAAVIADDALEIRNERWPS